MIGATLFGGMGNQMFIYATVRALSLRNKEPMAFNLKQGFKDDILFHRNLELRHFNLNLPEAKVDTFDIPCGKYFRFVSRKLGFNILKPWMKFVLEKKVKPQDVLQARNSYLEGYFANEIYFKEYKEEIRNDFTVSERYITPQIIKELSRIREFNRPIVMIGIRRYQECAKVSSIPQGGASETPEYFKKAIQYIKEKSNGPIFWVFSQQQEWFKEHVDDGSFDVVYAQPKDGPDSAIEDMYLMMQCDHYIITQSTYYWWAAWLSANNNNKIVVYPTSCGIHTEGWKCLE